MVAKILNLPKDVVEFINGELLGDGGVYLRKNSLSFNSAYFTVTDVHKTYAEYLDRMLNELGLKTRKISESTYSTSSEPRKKYCVSTVSYAGDIEILHNRWYLTDGYFCPSCEIFFPNEIIDVLKQRDGGVPRYKCPACNAHRLQNKLIPIDLILTPLIIRQWYIGDGCSSGGYLSFCTKAFLLNDLQILQQKLREIGIIASIWKNRVMYVNSKSVETFFKYIGKCPVECYNYKWASSDELKKARTVYYLRQKKKEREMENNKKEKRGINVKK